MTFASDLAETATKQSNKTTTTNGAKAFKSTLNANLDFYSKSGNIKYPTLFSDFRNAIDEDEDLALRNLLKMRDIRQGKGIRYNTRNLLSSLSKTNPSVILKTNLIEKLVEVGRWDDVFCLISSSNTEIRDKVVKFIATSLRDADENSLVAKWMPVNSKRNSDKVVSNLVRGYLKLTPKEFRQMVVSKRSQIVETKMCQQKWSEINYSHVPSKAMSIYHHAFMKKDETRFSSFSEKAANGEVKINAGTLWPHELLKGNITKSVEAQWKALPDFIKSDKSIFPIIDVSSSMTTNSYSSYSCMDVAIGLGMYIADRNKSSFKDLFITFDSNPRLLNIGGNNHSLEAKCYRVRNSPWGGSTNLEASFDLLLNQAIKSKASDEEMPKYIIVLTDMQMNPHYSGLRSYKDIRKKFKEAGYTCPNLIWWNLNSNNGNTPVKFDDDGTCLVSGYSPSVLEAILSDDLEQYNPMNVMLKDLMTDRYLVSQV